MSENPQHFENPLHWVQLFSRGIYYIPDDTIPVLDQVNLPAELPVELSTELAAELPVELSAEIPAEIPAELSAKLSAELPAELPSELPAKLSAELSAELLAELSTELAAELPVELAAELPAELPSELPGAIMDTIKENRLLEANIDKPFPMASEVILANVFMDEVDRVFLEDVALTFQRLMAALKVGNQTINPDKIANFHQPNDIFSQDNGFSKGASFSAAFTIIWSDQILKELPEMYEIDTISTGSSLRLPSFNTMIGSEGLKRKAWQCILNMLALEKSSDS